MAILIDSQTRVLIQGITGRQAQMNTQYMREYGTRVLAGVTPGKGGQKVLGNIPVYNSVAEAMKTHPDINATVIYVPPKSVKSACLESMDAGIPLILVTTERCPQHDVMEMIAYSRRRKSRIVGPNSIGIIHPGACVMGLIGARVSMANSCFKKGRIGVISRSGGQTSTLSYYLTQGGFGQSTAVGIGGDAFVGTPAKDVLELFQKDTETDAVVYFGEMGTVMEEETADFIKSSGFTKPLVAYIAGHYVMEGIRYGHAGALISRGRGDVASKLKALKSSGAIVLEHLDDVNKELRKALA